MRARIQGAVQGVGFRPFVYRLATELSLDGWVVNDARGLTIEVEGPRVALDELLARIEGERPAAAAIVAMEVDWDLPRGAEGFEIRPSDETGERTAQILPEIATCPACLGEVLDESDRRHLYPFTNCTLCGPRFTILRSLPYDRPRTSMAGFSMCPACRAEYESPLDRRFHAQPNACPACGPQLSLLDPGGAAGATGDAALQGAAEALRQGAIVAVKGLGGFHLLVDATNGAAVARLRERKPRRAKPFALMVRDLDQAREICHLDPQAEEALRSPEAPIVLLPRREGAAVDEGVAPGNPTWGVMLPYSPLHHLLLAAVGRPVVATSGNLSEEPICIENGEALEKLGGIAERFLVHDRPIVRHVDDSVAWIVDDQLRLLRRARGFAPRPLVLDEELPPVLAVGGHLKNTIALGLGRQVFVSQHLGDMESPEAQAAFREVIEDFLDLYDADPVAVACDLHPDYVTTGWARAAVGDPPASSAEAPSRLAGRPLIPVQHHHAHFAACLAENGHRGPALGVVWDGTGFGPDGVIWGGEFLLGDAAGFRRFACLRPFRLPGGDAAVREPRRSALALLWELGGERALEALELEPLRAFTTSERRALAGMLARDVHCPRTTSAGRLFDGVAALLGVCQEVSFEGQAAMGLEHLADPGVEDAYPISFEPPSAATAEPGLVDWRPLLEALLADLRAGVARELVASRFHGALVEAVVAAAEAAGQETVALSGGCMQNRLLTERALAGLRRAGFRVLLHRQVPPNDGGIACGQVAVAAARLRGE